MEQLKYRSVFDIIGPIMVGPSSSHTAGAARIGKIVRSIFGEQPDSVDILLYESFAKTYRGHGTDIALVGGLLGMEPDDARLADSLKIAYEKGIEDLCDSPSRCSGNDCESNQFTIRGSNQYRYDDRYERSCR